MSKARKSKTWWTSFAPAHGSARSLAIKVANAAEHAKKRGEDRCPYCQTVWVSSIDFKERHDLECPLPQARQVLNHD